MKKLVDFVYGVQQACSHFLAENPGEPILAADASKSIISSRSELPARGLDWVAAQRAVILLTPKRIICGNWEIPLHQVQQAQLLKVNRLLGSGQVLNIYTKDNKHYRFGMQFNPAWANQRVLPLLKGKARQQYSTFSIALRIVLFVLLAWWGYQLIS